MLMFITQFASYTSTRVKHIVFYQLNGVFNNSSYSRIKEIYMGPILQTKICETSIAIRV